MAEILILSDDPHAPETGGAWHTATQTFSDRARGQLAGREMVVLIPGQAVRALPHDLPALKPRERREAARFLIEPEIGQASEDTHIVIGDGTLRVVDRTYLRSVLDALDAAGVRALSVHADFDVLPPATLPDRIVMESATLDHGFPLGADAPPRMDFADALARADLALAPDLQTEEFARRRSFAPGIPASWMRRAAALVAFAGVSGLALNVAQARAESLQTEDLRARAVAAYADATGETVADPARAVRALPTRTGPEIGALDLVAVLFAALEQVPGASVDELRYADETGELELRLAYPGFDTPPQLERIVGELGGEMSAGGVRETGGRFIGEATLTARGGAN